MELFPRCIPTGLQHGTVTVLLDNCMYEVTTYRTESAYEDHRRPSSVAFISELDGDLLRRDLTINAMAMRMDGLLYDPYGGLADLRSGQISCVGNPEARYQEDALRMLRTIRFAAQFGFSIRHRTWRALNRHRGLLKHIAMERVCSELDRMISGASPLRAIELLIASQLLLHTARSLPVAVIWQASAATSTHAADNRYEYISRLSTTELRYAALLLESGAVPADCRETLEALRLPIRRMNIIFGLVAMDWDMLAFRGKPTEVTGIEWARIVLRYGLEIAQGWLEMTSANPTHSLVGHADGLRDWLEAMPAVTVKQLDINGKHLAHCLNRKPGAWTGIMLQRLLLAVASQELPNESEKLFAQATIWNVEDTNDEHN